MKASEERAGKGCLGKAADDEPVFVLRAQDKLAPAIISVWVEWAKEYGCPKEKLDEAVRTATEMKEWPHRKFPD